MDFQPDDDDDEEVEGEISISFAPRYEELTRLGISVEQFESSLLQALEEFETHSAQNDAEVDDLSLEEILLHIGGVPHRLGDLADIEIGDDDDDDDDEEEDDTLDTE